ncbi:zinc finger protein 37-like [Mastacembelus armatus]|uniref:Zinc finger protein 37-like n=1 Tax=Mastacembelus armatus TaxID=205130 RepID=A0A3Q3LTS4_9TELE|nr:zinc finger protein 37-like [Mastacembelus armatus]
MDTDVSDTVQSSSKLSKGETLRGFVAERLAAASRDILAVVDRVVAGYEEEASGFRQEIERQRRQLETVLLQPELTLSKAVVKSSRRLCPVEEDQGDDEESTECLKNLQDLNKQTPSRRRFEKRKPSRPRISKTQKHVDLRIRILEDPQTELLSNNVLRKCPVLKLQCPCGLKEADFLDLLRSTCPQLAGDDKVFDILTSNKRRRLQCLNLKTVTPEEIHRSISCPGPGTSTLFIRLKEQEEPQSSEKDVSTGISTSAVVTCDETSLLTSNPVQEVEGGRKEVLPFSSASKQEIETDKADVEVCRISEPAEDVLTHSVTEGKGGASEHCEKEEDREVATDSSDDWKPDRSDEELRESDSELQPKMPKRQKFRRSAVKPTEAKTESSGAVLSCRVCGALHSVEVLLVQHAWSHVDDPGSVCGVCGELSESKEALKDHLQSHHKTNDCHEVFALKVSLDNQLHEPGKSHQCHTCHKAFELKEELKAHRRTHISKTHLCGVCGKSLSDFRSLSRHKMTHTGERPHPCQICGQRFKLIGTLRQHEKIHTDRERSYLCDVCCKMFLTSRQLQIHMRTHTQEKPYHCGECGKGFSTKGHLTIHMRVHTGETPYRCPDCGWAFKRKVHLDNHVTIHSGVKPFVCGICGKACARKTYLIVHMRTHNGERPYKCNVCDKAFTQSHCLKTHMKSHLVGEAATED